MLRLIKHFVPILMLSFWACDATLGPEDKGFKHNNTPVGSSRSATNLKGVKQTTKSNRIETEGGIEGFEFLAPGVERLRFHGKGAFKQNPMFYFGHFRHENCKMTTYSSEKIKLTTIEYPDFKYSNVVKGYFSRIPCGLNAFFKAKKEDFPEFAVADSIHLYIGRVRSGLSYARKKGVVEASILDDNHLKRTNMIALQVYRGMRLTNSYSSHSMPTSEWSFYNTLSSELQRIDDREYDRLRLLADGIDGYVRRSVNQSVKHCSFKEKKDSLVNWHVKYDTSLYQLPQNMATFPNTDATFTPVGWSKEGEFAYINDHAHKHSTVTHYEVVESVLPEKVNYPNIVQHLSASLKCARGDKLCGWIESKKKLKKMGIHLTPNQQVMKIRLREGITFDTVRKFRAGQWPAQEGVYQVVSWKRNGETVHKVEVPIPHYGSNPAPACTLVGYVNSPFTDHTALIFSYTHEYSLCGSLNDIDMSHKVVVTTFPQKVFSE